MEIKVTQANNSDLKPRPADESQIGFGDIFTDHMFLMDYESGTGWHNPRIEPYRNISIDPYLWGDLHCHHIICQASDHPVEPSGTDYTIPFFQGSKQ